MLDNFASWWSLILENDGSETPILKQYFPPHPRNTEKSKRKGDGACGKHWLSFKRRDHCYWKWQQSALHSIQDSGWVRWAGTLKPRFDTTGKGVWTGQEKGEPARSLLQKHLWETELLCLCMKAVRYEALCSPERTKIDAYQSTHQKLLVGQESCSEKQHTIP